MKKILTCIFCISIFFCHGQQFQKLDSLMINADYEKVVKVCDELLQKNVEHTLILNRKAEAFLMLGNFDEAESTLKKINAINSFEEAITKTSYGLFYIHKGRNDLAEEVLKSSLLLFDKEGKQNTLEAAKALNLLGQVYNILGKQSQAQEQLMMALTIRQRLLPGQHELIAGAYNDLGLSYVRSDNDKALDYYEKALEIYRSLHGSEHPKIAIASINSGLVYRELELYGDAVNNFETALKIWEKNFKEAHPSKAFALLNLGQTYLKMGDQKAARAYFEKALSVYTAAYGSQHPDIANTLNMLGNLDITENHYTSALQYYQKALMANVKDFQSTDVYVNPDGDNFYNGTVLLYTLHLKAQAFEKRYFGHSLKYYDLLSGLKTLQLCDSLIDNLRQQSSNEADKINLGALANDVYADGVRVCSEIALNSTHPGKYKALAFYFAEKSKSAVLLEAIADANAKSFSGIPADLLEQEQSIKAALTIVTQKLSEKPGEHEERSLREKSFLLNKQYKSFTDKLEKDFPQYFNLKFNKSTASVSDLQSALKDTEAVISYFIDEKNKRLYTFIITRNNFQLKEKNLPDQFERYITGLRNGITFNDPKTYLKSVVLLSEQLIPKINPAVKDLVIIPTGRLGIIPFETLLTSETETADFKNLPYLVKKYSIRYEFSAALLLQKTKTPSSVKKPSIMLCAPVKFNENDRLPDLPGTQSEVETIEQMFSSKQLQTFRSLQQDATETVIKSDRIKDYNFLHFATHGIVDESNPELSRIFLQESEQEDGKLYCGEIYNLQLNADLVTLSACQTGLGKISKGEGVVGLSRALAYAGAKNMIVSFWSVADQSTAQLMKSFYNNLLSDEKTSYTSGLRQAKIDMIETSEYNAPYFWAPFILIGY